MIEGGPWATLFFVWARAIWAFMGQNSKAVANGVVPCKILDKIP